MSNTLVYFPEKLLDDVNIGPYSVRLKQFSYKHENGKPVEWQVERWRFFSRVASGVYDSVDEARQAFEAQRQAAIIDIACEAMGLDRPRNGHAKGAA